MLDETTQDNLSEFYDAPVDAKEAESILKANQQPAGDYTTDPETFGEFNVTPSINEDDGNRPIFTFFGRAQVTRKGETTEASLRYRISPDARVKKNFETGEEVEGKNDLQTRLWAEAVALYTTTHGKSPESRRSLIEYLQTAALRLNTMNGEDGLIVLHIKGVRRR